MIAAGGFADGRLPREEVLALELGVSRGTARAALRSLEEQGLITRQRGRGTYVNQHVADSGPAINQIAGFYELIEQAGYQAGIAWTHVIRRPADAELERRLGLEPATPVITIERLFTGDSTPVLHVTESLAAKELASGEPAETAVPNSIFEFADMYCREPIDHTVVDIVPVVTDADSALLFGASVGMPLLALTEAHYTVRGRPFMLSKIQVDHRYLQFTVVRRRPA